MFTILHWNVQKKVLSDSVARLAFRLRADVIVLTECRTDSATMLAGFHAVGLLDMRSVKTIGSRFSIFTRIPEADLEVIIEGKYLGYTGLKANRPGGKQLLLFALHAPAKPFNDDDDRIDFFGRMHARVQKLEEQHGSKLTVFIGDFNANPYENSVTSSIGLHAVPDRKTALRLSREVYEEERPFMFNPVWENYGDLSSPTGTYYFGKNKTVNVFWHLIDQAIVRPQLIDFLSEKAFRILDSDGMHSFLNGNGHPDTEKFSDHLPIALTLDL